LTVFAWELSAQSPPAGAATTDSELVVEIRGLRADLNRALGANIRAQLLVGRLQLQEQRINVLSGQLAEVRRGLVGVEAGRVEPPSQLQDLEQALRTGSLPPGPDRDVGSMIARLKTQLAQAQREEHRLLAQETELAVQVETESNRWSFFNERLDDIERTLLSANDRAR
jgi:hypothetical protein